MGLSTPATSLETEKSESHICDPEMMEKIIECFTFDENQIFGLLNETKKTVGLLSINPHLNKSVHTRQWDV